MFQFLDRCQWRTIKRIWERNIQSSVGSWENARRICFGRDSTFRKRHFVEKGKFTSQFKFTWKFDDFQRVGNKNYQIIERIRRVTAADTIVVPAYSEKWINVFIDRFENDKNLPYYIFCIEPFGDFNNIFFLLMASCLTDLSKKVSTKVRVINSFKTDVGIQQDKVLRGAELIDSKNIDVILSLESLSENNQPTRRIQLHKYSQREITPIMIQDTILKIHRNSLILPT